jgi:hypothetical protein
MKLLVNGKLRMTPPSVSRSSALLPAIPGRRRLGSLLFAFARTLLRFPAEQLVFPKFEFGLQLLDGLFQLFLAYFRPLVQASPVAPLSVKNVSFTSEWTLLTEPREDD